MQPIPPTEQPEQTAPPTGGAAAAQGAPARDPKILAAHKKIVQAAMKALYSSKEMVQQVLNMVRQEEDPAIGIVKAATMILDGLADKAKGINPDFVYSATAPLALMILELALEAKLVQPGEEKGIIQRGFAYMQQGGEPAAPTGEEPEEEQPEEEPEQEEEPAPGGVINEEMEA